MTDTKRPTLQILNNSKSEEFELSDAAMHHVVAESQRRGVSIDKVMEDLVKAVIEQHEQGLSAEDYLKSEPWPGSAVDEKPSLKVIK